ncbi:hypothetical protein [Nocardioides sp.]|uniref:hypothetical protein n=1 Tax=Nocardioides sp. TaxID=35761 RepID=UPI0026100202|nr:hypothetical protein [Nocardioides sp.]
MSPRWVPAVAGLAGLALLAGCGAGTSATGGSTPAVGGTSSTASPAGAATTGTASTGSTGSSSAAATGAAAAPTLHVHRASYHLPAGVAREAIIGSGPVVTVAGGLLPGDGSTDQAYRLDLRTGATTALPNLAVKVHDTAGGQAGIRGLVIGGGNASEQDVVQSFAGGAWRVMGHLPAARSDLSALDVGGKVVVVGGYNGTRPAEPAILASTDGRTWRTIGHLPVPVRYAATAVADGKIWVIGGEVSHAMQTAVQKVDPATGAATVVAHLPHRIGHASAVVLGSRILIAGGRTSTDAITDRMTWFDPATLRTSPAGRLPRPLSDAAVATDHGVGYLVGGESPSDVSTVLALRWG